MSPATIAGLESHSILHARNEIASESKWVSVAKGIPKVAPSLKTAPSPNRRRLLDRAAHDVLTAPAKASPAAATAIAGLAPLKAALAVHRTVASGLEWNGRLLSAPGTDHGCTLCSAALVSAATARLFVLLGLAARFAALWRRITAIAEKILIFR